MAKVWMDDGVELYPVCQMGGVRSCGCVEIDVDEATLARWRAAEDAWQAVQDEMQEAAALARRKVPGQETTPAKEG